ncbi:OmpA family protein [Roseovarius spongiae]|uniref:OmpA family protein n=1 Tax=Roseovarius spongiae TaxID=2320272 RepID=A0A3A8ARE7_9RHOB|nr:OmpA family protein [Roseovarius spongiae]
METETEAETEAEVEADTAGQADSDAQAQTDAEATAAEAADGSEEANPDAAGQAAEDAPEGSGDAQADSGQTTGEANSDDVQSGDEDATGADAQAEAAETIEDQTEADTADATDAETTEAQAEADTADGAEAETEAQAEAETNDGAEAETEGQAEAETADGTETETTEGQTEAEVTETTDDADAGQTEAAETDAGEAGGEQLSDAERQALEQERAEQEAAAAASEDAATEEAEVETQTVTEEDVRSSAEEFATDVTGNAQATASSEDEGLSNLEKALLLGAGAAVVGAILSNGDKVVSNSGDRIVVERDGQLRVLKNDDELLRRPGAQVRTQTFQDGSTRSTVDYEDGSQIVTVRAADGTVLRRTLIRASDGQEVVLFDDTKKAEPIDFDRLPSMETISARQRDVTLDDRAALQDALQRVKLADVDRTFSLRQVRDYKRVRALAPVIELDAITFETGSAAIRPDQAEALADLGKTMRELVKENPRAIFLVEGHTDAIGDATYNLALSDRRAETVALALTEYFDVPPQNLITQGYGESDLKVRTLQAERANRRAAVRNITHLLH